MFIKKRNLILISIILIIITSIIAGALTFYLLNPFGIKGADDFLKLCNGISVLISNYYEEIQDSDIVDGALSGAAHSTLNPYTSYIPSSMADDFLQDVGAEDYSGVGLYISKSENDDHVEVVAPLSNSPGEKAGITTGDKILKVDGKEVFGDSIDEASDKMKGKKGTEVLLTILKKDSGEVVDIKLIRDVIKIETVEKKLLEDNIGVLDISQFGVNTFEEFIENFNSLSEEGMEKLVIDLRNNPGGYMEIAVQIADAFIDSDKMIVYTKDKAGNVVEYTGTTGCVELPIIILTNGGSASASEILTGALKDNGIAKVVGEKSFGKGLTQIPYQFKDKSILKITNSRYFTPSGKCIDKEGIMPDFEVKMDIEKYSRLSSLTLEEDEQLIKAIEVLKEME